MSCQFTPSGDKNSVHVLPCKSILVAVDPDHRAVAVVLHSDEAEALGIGSPAILLDEKAVVEIIIQLQVYLRDLRLLPVSLEQK